MSQWIYSTIKKQNKKTRKVFEVQITNLFQCGELPFTFHQPNLTKFKLSKFQQPLICVSFNSCEVYPLLLTLSLTQTNLQLTIVKHRKREK
jgi:hypothetical protein